MKIVYVECKPDVILVKSVMNIPKRHIIHVGGKSEICKRMEKQRNCTGLLDEDPWSVQPPYIEKMEVKDDLPQYGLRMLYDTSRNNYCVVLCPRLENWILHAQDADKKVGEYGLPNDAVKLHETINVNLDKFEKLVEDLTGCKRLKALSRLLKKSGL